jgi:hypothetical protein
VQYQVSIAPVNPFAEAGLRSDSLRQFIQQRGFFMIHVKRGADPLFVSAQDHGDHCRPPPHVHPPQVGQAQR